jgi:hypothetical protein
MARRSLYPIPPPNSTEAIGETQAPVAEDTEWQIITKKRKTGTGRVGRPRKIDTQEAIASQDIGTLFSLTNSTQIASESQDRQDTAEQATQGSTIADSQCQ